MPDSNPLPQLPTLRARFTWARNREGLSLENLAQRLSGPVNWLILRQIEQGNTQKTSQTLGRDIANVLNVDYNWLVNDPAPASLEGKTVMTTTAGHRVLAAAAPVKSVVKETAIVWRPGMMKPKNPASLAAKVREARLKTGLSQLKAAKRIGVADLAIGYIERDIYKKMVRIDEVDRVLIHYGITHDDWEVYKKTNRSYQKPQANGAIGEAIAAAMAAPALTHFHTVPGAGKRIKDMRVAMGVSQYGAASGIGTSQTVISLTERGKRTVPLSVAKVAEFFGTTSDYILKGEGNSPKPAHSSPLNGAFKKAQKAAMPPKVEAPKVEQPAPVVDSGEYIRPRQVDEFRTVADKSGIYVFFSQRVFRRNGAVLTPSSASVANLSLSPEAAEMLIEDLRDAVKQARS